MNEEKILLELKYIKQQVDNIVDGLTGDPSNVDRPGLFLRVDRLEQSKKAHNWLLGMIFTGGVITTGTVAAALLVKYLA